MSEDIGDLKNKIQELEEALEDKEIMINLLLKEVKRSRSSSTDNLPKRFKSSNVMQTETIKQVDCIRKEEIVIQDKETIKQDKEIIKQDKEIIKQDKEIIKQDKETVKQDKETVKQDKDKEEIVKQQDPQNWNYKYKLKDDLENLLNKKKVVKVFKDNVFFDEFVEFCSDVYLVPSFDEIIKVTHAKNVKKYLQENKTRVLKYLMLNINKLPFNSICSTFVALSTEFSDLEKLVIIHDIILYTQDYSKILFFVFCIINANIFFQNIPEDDILRNALCNILSFQVLVDLEIHKNKKIVVHTITMIKNILGLKRPTMTVEDTLFGIKTDLPCFSKFKVNPDIYKFIYAVRSLSHFLDWEYIYNTFIIEYLVKDITSCKILFLGLLGFNSLRIFGNTESTDIIFKFIRENMTNTEETGIVSYLLLKQVNEKASMEYLEKEGEDLKKKGYDLEYLRKLVIY